MRDVRQYWQEIQALETTLPEFARVVSITASITEVPARLAAKLLHARSHRLATEEENQACVAADESRNRETAREELRRRGIAVVAVTK